VEMKLSEMIKGWFIGNFEPTAYKTDNCEVAVKEYKTGDYESFHHHRLATEITVILEGKVKMNNKLYSQGDIVIINKKEGTDFLAITDVKNIVVKIPGATNDKYIGKYNTNIS